MAAIVRPPVKGGMDVIDITLVSDTAILADNDVIAITAEVLNFFQHPGDTVEVRSLVLIDEDDQAQDVEVVFLNATGSVGAANAKYAPADSVLRTIIGSHVFLTTDYSDGDTGQTATKTNVGLLLRGGNNTTSLFIAAVCRSGTPTYTASGLRLKVGVKYSG